MARYYFEDFSPGDRWEFGAWSLSRDDIVAFAAEHDPQPLHMDEAAAARTQFGGIIASGWQTTMKCIRFFVDGLMVDTAGLSSPGLDNIRWLKAVRPGDRITASAEVIAVEPSKTRPDRGRVHFLFSGHNQNGDAVMTCSGPFFIEKRSPG